MRTSAAVIAPLTKSSRSARCPQALARRREIVIDTILRYVKQAP
jgi:hypothetical protein